jgi:hypothetical protein
MAVDEVDAIVRGYSDHPAPTGRDRRVADNDPTRTPFRGDAGTPPGPRPSSQLGLAQHQRGQGRGREPAATPHRATTVDSWADIRQLADQIGSSHGPLVLFAAATGLRPGEWIALEHRDIDVESGVLYVNRAFRNGRLECPKTDASTRAVPLQAIALAALEELPPRPDSPLVGPALRGGYLDLHNFRNREWKPAQRELGIEPIRRVYDLRPSLRSRSAPASRPSTSPLHGRKPDHDRPPLQPPRQRRPPACDQSPRHVHRAAPSTSTSVDVVDVTWTPDRRRVSDPPRQTCPEQEETPSPLSDSNRRPLPYHHPAGDFGCSANAGFSCKSQLSSFRLQVAVEASMRADASKKSP